jgi:hypothetical protein
MADDPKDPKEPAAPKAAKAPESLVLMKHEVYRHKHRMAIGEAWFEVADDGTASFPLSLVEAAEMAGFRRVV